MVTEFYACGELDSGIFQFWSKIEFAKLVKIKCDHQWDFTY